MTQRTRKLHNAEGEFSVTFPYITLLQPPLSALLYFLTRTYFALLYGSSLRIASFWTMKKGNLLRAKL